MPAIIQILVLPAVLAGTLTLAHTQDTPGSGSSGQPGATQEPATVSADAPRPPQPPVGPSVVGGPSCRIEVQAFRQKYPTLFDFFQEIGFEGSDEIFATRKDVMNYYFSSRRLQVADLRAAAGSPAATNRAERRAARREVREAREALRAQRRALRAEIQGILAEYPKGPCRRIAWSILGQANTSDAAIESVSNEAASASKVIDEQ